MIKVKSVSKTYQSKDINIVALDNISFDLPSKGLVFITGKSGSGKSTLLNVLGVLDTFDEGDIIVENKSIKSFTEQEANNYRNSYVGFVFQEFNLIDEYDVEQNISLGFNLQSEVVNKIKIEEVLKKVELEEVLKRKPNRLSGGQRQRVAIARALIKSPHILLCDEPTGSLDSDTGDTIFQLLKDLSKDKLVIVISHDKESAIKYGDRIIEMKDGKINSDSINGPIESENKELILNKYQLSFKNVIKFSYNFLRRRPIRLFIAMFLSVFAFVLLCFSDTISSYNKEKTLLNSMYKNNNSYISFNKKLGGIESDGSFIYSINFNNEDVNFLKNQIHINEYDLIYDYFGSEDYNLGNTFNKNSDYYKTSIEGICEIDQNFIRRYGFDLYGNLPIYDDQVVITKYAYEMYQEFGYYDHIDNKIITINTMDDLINRTLPLYRHKLDTTDTFTITGILDTHFNYQRYKILLDDKNNKINSQFNIEINEMVKYGFHNLLYFRENFYQENIYEFHKNQYKSKDSFNIISKNSDSQDTNNRNFDRISILNDLDTKKIYWKNENSLKLERNQVLLPLSSIILYNRDREIEQVIIDFAKQNYSIVSDYFTNHYNYAEYIIENKENNFQPEYNYEYFENYFYYPLINELFFDIYDQFFFDTLYSNNTFQTEVEIVGFYDDSGDYRKTIYVSEDFMEVFREYAKDYKFIVIPLTKSYSKDIKYIEFSNKSFLHKEYLYDTKVFSNYKIYSIDNEVQYSINHIEGLLEVVVDIFKFVSIGALIFVIIFIGYYFSGVISDKKREIGVLRALGASKKDVIKIFITESIIISFASVLISIVLSIIVISILNNWLITNYHLIESIFRFGIRQIGLVIFIEIFVAFFGIIIPLIKLMKKKPVDIIANR